MKYFRKTMKLFKLQNGVTISITLAILILTFSTKARAAEISYYIYDSPSRSVVAISDSTQNVINTYNYEDFGKTKQVTESKQNAYKYNGEQYEAETGLIFLRNRYY